MEVKKLYRSCNDKIVGGVAGGVAEYLDLDPIIVRLLFLVLILSGIGFAAYLVAWVLVPVNPSCKDAKEGAEEIAEKATSLAASLTGKDSKNDNGLRVLFGLLIVAFGLMLLFQNIFGAFIWKVFWPIVLVFVGLYLVTNSKK